MKKQSLREELNRMYKLAGLIREDDNDTEERSTFDGYSNDAILDMIINLSRYEGNEEEIEIAKRELQRRKEKVNRKN